MADRYETILPKRSRAADVHLALLVQLSAMARALDDPAPKPTELSVFAAARQRRADAIARTLGGRR